MKAGPADLAHLRDAIETIKLDVSTTEVVALPRAAIDAREVRGYRLSYRGAR
jgi:hypothetical protein